MSFDVFSIASSFFSLYLKSEPNFKKEKKLKKTAEDYFLKQSKKMAK